MDQDASTGIQKPSWVPTGLKSASALGDGRRVPGNGYQARRSVALKIIRAELLSNQEGRSRPALPRRVARWLRIEELVRTHRFSSWMGLEEDLPLGEHLTSYVRLFIEHLASSSLSPRTLRRLMLG